MANDSLVRCLRCKRTYIRSEYDGHTCVPLDNGTKDIEVIQFWQTKTPNNQPCVFALGTDGITYRIIEVKSKLGFVEVSPNESEQVPTQTVTPIEAPRAITPKTKQNPRFWEQ